MYTKYTPSHYSTYLTFCTRFTKSDTKQMDNAWQIEDGQCLTLECFTYEKLELIQVMAVYYVKSWSEICMLIRFPIINHLPFFYFFNHYTANASSIVLLYTISTWRFLYRWLAFWNTILSKLLWCWLYFKTFNVKLVRNLFENQMKTSS